MTSTLARIDDLKRRGRLKIDSHFEVVLQVDHKRDAAVVTSTVGTKQPITSTVDGRRVWLGDAKGFRWAGDDFVCTVSTNYDLWNLVLGNQDDPTAAWAGPFKILRSL